MGSLTRAARAGAKAVAAALLLGGGSDGSSLVYFGQELGMAGAGGPEPMQWGAAHPFTSGCAVGGDGAERGHGKRGGGGRRCGLGAALVSAAGRAAAGECGAAGRVRWRCCRRSRAQGWRRAGRRRVRDGVGSAGAGWASGKRLPVVVLVNLSPYTVAVTPAGFAGGGLRVLATTFPVASQTMGSGPVALPAYGVFVGEVKKPAGLETVVIPARTRHGR